MKIKKILALAAITLFLTGCETASSVESYFKGLSWGTQANSQAQFISAPQGCPKVAIFPELSKVSEFTTPDTTDKDELIGTAYVLNVGTRCVYNNDRFLSDIQITFNGELGPKGRARAADEVTFSYPYFFAVVGPNGGISTKKVYAFTTTYPANKTRTTATQTVQEQIVLPDRNAGDQYTIYIGFQLSEEQLKYNRDMGVTAPVITQEPAPVPAQ
ncbi:MAG: hypothetical protein GC136_10620 [Alphaproteobacteria bacterium]|nr:hypothetical protein [Alphaproteobacteria bacterium]